MPPKMDCRTLALGVLLEARYEALTERDHAIHRGRYRFLCRLYEKRPLDDVEAETLLPIHWKEPDEKTSGSASKKSSSCFGRARAIDD